MRRRVHPQPSTPLAEVLAAGQRIVRGDDRVNRSEERRRALQLSRCASGLPCTSYPRGGVEVALEDHTVFERLGREDVREAVLGDQPVRDDSEDLHIELANRVHAPVAELIECVYVQGLMIACSGRRLQMPYLMLAAQEPIA